MSDFDFEHSGTGTAEWAEVTENIQLGCRNNCKYCYAAYNANKFKKRERSKWQEEQLTKRAEATAYPFKEGVVMFPSSHDITPYNVDAYCRVAKLICEAGNKLLVVSKPRQGPIFQVCQSLRDFKNQVLFRFTIGSVIERVLSFWEPGAPCFSERIRAVEETKNLGFRTSVSCEPLLGGFGTACELVRDLERLVTDTIWIGKMNKIHLRVYPQDDETLKAIQVIELMQKDPEILGIYKAFKDNPKVRWKDSIKDVLARNICPV